MIDAVDHTVYFSEVEVQTLAEILPTRDIRSIPPLLYLEDKALDRRLDEIPQLLFVAGFNHPPNIDAACWFVSEVLPLIEKTVGSVFTCISQDPTPTRRYRSWLRTTSLSTATYRMRPCLDLYSTSHCAVVPLRFGAGVKGKVLEAIQYGVPLVTTLVGAEGIPDYQKVMAVSDDPRILRPGCGRERAGSKSPLFSRGICRSSKLA